MCRHTACAQWKLHALISCLLASSSWPSKIQGHPLHLRVASQELQDDLEDFLIELLRLPRHEAEEEGNLFTAVARPHKAVDGEELVEGGPEPA